MPQSVAPTTCACTVYQDLPCWCELILPIMRSLSGLNIAADFVEELKMKLILLTAAVCPSDWVQIGCIRGSTGSYG